MSSFSIVRENFQKVFKIGKYFLVVGRNSKDWEILWKKFNPYFGDP